MAGNPFYPATTSPDSFPVTALRTRTEQRNVDDVAETSEKGIDRLILLEIFMEMLSRCFPVEKFWATIISVPAGWKQGPRMGGTWPLVAAWAVRMELVELLADWSLYMSENPAGDGPEMHGARKRDDLESRSSRFTAIEDRFVVRTGRRRRWSWRLFGLADGDLVDRDRGGGRAHRRHRSVGDREARIIREAVSCRWEEIGVLGSDKAASRNGQGLVLLPECRDR